MRLSRRPPTLGHEHGAPDANGFLAALPMETRKELRRALSRSLSLFLFPSYARSVEFATARRMTRAAVNAVRESSCMGVCAPSSVDRRAGSTPTHFDFWATPTRLYGICGFEHDVSSSLRLAWGVIPIPL